MIISINWRNQIIYLLSSLAAQRVKRLPAMQKTWVQSLGQEDPLEKEMATHSSTLAWKIPWTEKPGSLQSMGLTKSRTRLSDFTHSLTCEREALVAVMFSKQCALLRDCRGSRAGAGGDTPAEPWELGTGPT